MCPFYLLIMLFSSAISLWLWGHIVQLHLDEIMHENRIHKIRKQKKTLLPSGGCRIDIYNNPQKFGAHLKDWLIHIPDEIIDNLLQKYDRPDVEQAYVGIYYLAQSLDGFAAQCNT